MLQISHEQNEALAEMPREIFVEKMTMHLLKMQESLELEHFQSEPLDNIKNRLRIQIDYMIEHGFEKESEIATAIEYFELFNVKFADANTQIMLAQKEYTTAKKLSALWKLRLK